MSAPIAPTGAAEDNTNNGAFARMAAMSTKGAGLIAKSLTMTAKPYKGASRRERMSRKKPTAMTPSSKQVFHMLTTQTEKQEVFDAIKGRMSVHQQDHGGGGHGHKGAMSKKNVGISHLSQQAIDTSWVFDQHYVINPRSYQRKAWDIMLTLMVFYLISILPWQLGVPFYHAPKELYTFDTVLEVVFWLDMIATLNTGFIHAGEVELDRGEIVEHYLSTWFLVDFIGNFPFYAFIGKRGGKGFKLLKWLKLNKLFRIGKLVRYLRDYVKFASVIKYTSAFVVFIHVTACLAVGQLFGHHDLYYISYWEMYWHALAQVVSLAVGGNIQANVITIQTHYSDDDGGHRRLAGVVSNITNATTTDDHTDDGHGDDHAFDIDSRRFSNELSIAIIMIGTILLIFLSASIVVILSNRSNTTMKFKLKIENMKTELEYYDIDELLADRVMEFYDYLWFNQLNSDESSVHKDSMLSNELRRELILTIYSDMLTSTPFLSACTEDCVANVANKLVNTIAMPADFIIRKKDIGRELFIIKKGMVGVFNDLQYLKSLQKGQYFGEVALLGEKKHRTATVRAISVCELCVLYAADFAHISGEYPELLVNMTQYMNATHLDSDLVKNPKVQARRKTNLGEQINAAKAEKGTPMQRKNVEEMLSHNKESPGFLAGVHNLSSRALGSMRSSLMSPVQMMSKIKSAPTPQQHHPQRNMSVGTQLAGLLGNMNNGGGAPIQQSDSKFSPNSLVQKDDASLGFTKEPPSKEDVRGMISGLLAARLEPEPEGDEDEDEDDDDDDFEVRANDNYDYAQVSDGRKPSQIVSMSKQSDSANTPTPSNPSHSMSDLASRMQAQHEADAAAVSEPVIIHTSTSTIDKDVSEASLDRARARRISEVNATAVAEQKLAEALVSGDQDKQTIEELRTMVNELKGTLDSTNKSLEELSKVVIITHAAATNEGHELADAIIDREREQTVERTAGRSGAGSMAATPGQSYNVSGATPSGTYNRDREKEEKSISRSYNRKKKKKETNVHISRAGGSIYDAENEDPEIYAAPSYDASLINHNGSTSFSDRRTGKISRGRSPSHDTYPEPVKVPSVDSVDLHLADIQESDPTDMLINEEEPKRASSIFSAAPRLLGNLLGNSYNKSYNAAEQDPDSKRSAADSPVGRKSRANSNDPDAVQEF